MLIVEAADIADVKIITPKQFGDRRGFFSEVYSRRHYEAAGIDHDFVQDNHALSADRGTLRGMHFQTPPFAQGKLVRVTRGRILDVAVDLRRSSSTFGRHVAVEISAANWRQVFVPAGFAHGYLTLEPDTEVLYKATNYYAPKHDFGLAFDDPALAIDWGIPMDQLILSDKDRKHPRLADLPPNFD
jgi:dTDP-4-dehydrorhamnose 3,5-epimerase